MINPYHRYRLGVARRREAQLVITIVRFRDFIFAHARYDDDIIAGVSSRRKLIKMTGMKCDGESLKLICVRSKNSSLISTSMKAQRRRKKKKKERKERIDRRRVASKLTRAVKLGASGDVVHAAVDSDQYPAVRTLAVVLGQFLDREVASQLGQLLHLLHGLLGLRAALDDLVDEDGDHAHQGEIYRALDDLADEARQKLLLRRQLFLSGRSSRRAALLGHLDESEREEAAEEDERLTRTGGRAPIE